MRLPLTTIEIFNAIADTGSLKGAADRLGLKPSTVSHQLKTLEERLDTALFIRTTRSVRITEAGRALLRGTEPAFEQIANAVEAAQTTGHEARGSLKLAMPDFVYSFFIQPKLESFCKTYPEIELELSLTDALSDILGEGLHAGFRFGDRISQDMVAIRISPPLPLAIVASPDYLAKYGTPQKPEDLLNHNCIRYRFHSSGKIAQWGFKSDDGDRWVEIAGQMITNSVPSCADLAEKGLGLSHVFRDLCKEQLDDGRLVSVLDDHILPTPGVYVYFPREYRSMMPLRHFLDHLRDG